MMILSPSILSADFSRLGEDIKLLDQGGAKYIHIDVMDGNFVPSISFGFPVIESIRKITDRVFDVHLMIAAPERYIEQFSKAGADIITFHIEACNSVKETIEAIHALGIKAGISLKPATPIEEVLPYLEMVDMVLLMTVEPGFGGQSYIETSTEKIKKLRHIVDQRQLPVDIEVDGGINKNNIGMIMEAGANVIVSGSAIFKGDIVENIRYFHKVFQDGNR
ncbi:MAG: ribulose-phosphate 3-epimerase [Clostridiales bacterium]|nr:ribulose-phosphate 3-epimerase [Clostridiales bacterium]